MNVLYIFDTLYGFIIFVGPPSFPSATASPRLCWTSPVKELPWGEAGLQLLLPLLERCAHLLKPFLHWRGHVRLNVFAGVAGWEGEVKGGKVTHTRVAHWVRLPILSANPFFYLIIPELFFESSSCPGKLRCWVLQVLISPPLMETSHLPPMATLDCNQIQARWSKQWGSLYFILIRLSWSVNECCCEMFQ